MGSTAILMKAAGKDNSFKNNQQVLPKEVILTGCFWIRCNIKLDVFHAVQHITRALSKEDKYYCQFVSEFRMMF